MKGEGVAVVQREKFGGATDREIKLSGRFVQQKGLWCWPGCWVLGCWGAHRAAGVQRRGQVTLAFGTGVWGESELVIRPTGAWLPIPRAQEKQGPSRIAA